MEDRRARIYVVEVMISGHYVPTVGVGLDREQARRDLHQWREKNPDDKFRLNIYVRTK